MRGEGDAGRGGRWCREEKEKWKGRGKARERDAVYGCISGVLEAIPLCMLGEHQTTHA